MLVKVRQRRICHNILTYLIHILAKHETPMKANKTTLGFVPARFRILVIRTRSIFVLLNADEMEKPPIRSMMVGENICENTYLVID